MQYIHETKEEYEAPEGVYERRAERKTVAKRNNVNEWPPSEVLSFYIVRSQETTYVQPVPLDVSEDTIRMLSFVSEPLLLSLSSSDCFRHSAPNDS